MPNKQSEWVPVQRMLPKEGEAVLTLSEGRSEQILIRKGKLWYHEDMSMYVYYTPTHWKLNN